MEQRYTDEELLVRLKNGDREAESELYERYKQTVRSRARTYFLIGADHEDLVQEGMIGLYRAVLEYDPEKAASFHSFADLCITRQILTAIKRASRKKHGPLNSYVSLNRPVFEKESEVTLLDMVQNLKVSDPEEQYIGQENLEQLQQIIQEQLSDLERKVLGLYLEGRSYREIAELLQKTPKAIDNAIQRVKRKLEPLL